MIAKPGPATILLNLTLFSGSHLIQPDLERESLERDPGMTTGDGRLDSKDAGGVLWNLTHKGIDLSVVLAYY